MFPVPPINIPSGTLPTTVSPPHEAPADETAQPTPSRIIERSQTLWEFPGTPRTPLSPRAPPALEKPRPSELLLSRKNPCLDSLRCKYHHQRAAPSPVPSGSLSPLIRVPAPVLPVPGPSSISAGASAMQRNGKIPSSSKGKAKETAEDLDAQATAFLRRSSVVKKHFKTWVRRTTDRAEWLEACERSELYKEKLRRERLASGLGSGHTKAHENGAQKTRGPSRLTWRNSFSKTSQTACHSPLFTAFNGRGFSTTVERESRGERTAMGAGLVPWAVRSQVKDVIPRGTDAPEWRIWLSMNPGNDQTAIWLEHKFDVPASGDWFRRMYSLYPP
ncbi:hypothetical protein A0H81_07192 [Grifola frondosa]|uniref:Uncharacterized protein n=1 Tax=Grifola frondosa TaxID=5627 RepID=A0A1C7M8R1_GRIFR|nr:hypothetical protein A0H81_07192 [Grifola frondosa]